MNVGFLQILAPDSKKQKFCDDGISATLSVKCVADKRSGVTREREDRERSTRYIMANRKEE